VTSPSSGHRAARGGRSQDQLEERDGVAQALLQRPERTVAVVGGDERPLRHEGDDRDAQPSTAPSGERAPPDMDDRSEERHGDHAVADAKGARGR
jgi:hypothetical protein